MFENEVTDLCCSTCKAEVACKEIASPKEIKEND